MREKARFVRKRFVIVAQWRADLQVAEVELL
jgi:hypothetical protein